MKYIRYIAVIIALVFLASRAEAKIGPVAINLIATQQALLGATVSKTNHTAIMTNIVGVQKITTTNTIINNVKILKMLANSFNTNFPRNAALNLNEDGNFVVAVGTNVILNVNSVLNLTYSGATNAVSGLITENMKLTPAGFSASVNESKADSAIDTLTYDDSSLSTADGSTTKFKIQGYRTLRQTGAASVKDSTLTATTTYVVTMTGAGTGVISSKAAVLKGTVTGTTSVPNIDL